MIRQPYENQTWLMLRKTIADEKLKFKSLTLKDTDSRDNNSIGEKETEEHKKINHQTHMIVIE